MDEACAALSCKTGAEGKLSRKAGGCTGTDSSGNCGTVRGTSTPLTVTGAGTDEGEGGDANDFEGCKRGIGSASRAASEETCGVTKPLRAGLEDGVEGITTVSAIGVVVREGMEPVLPATGATQDDALPPLAPEHVHVQGPLPLTTPVIPEEHKPLCGLTRVDVPLAGPQAPSIGEGGSRGAVQLTLIPPFSPRQLQFQGPLPAVVVAVPPEQSPSTGAEVAVAPLA